MRSKKVIIVINLVEESAQKSNEEIEKNFQLPRIPWQESVEKVTVLED